MLCCCLTAVQAMPACDAAWLRCTAIEVEADNMRRMVSVSVQCSVPRQLSLHESTGAGDHVFFRGGIMNFGAVRVGELATAKVRCVASSGVAAGRPGWAKLGL